MSIIILSGYLIFTWKFFSSQCFYIFLIIPIQFLLHERYFLNIFNFIPNWLKMKILRCIKIHVTNNFVIFKRKFYSYCSCMILIKEIKTFSSKKLSLIKQSILVPVQSTLWKIHATSLLLLNNKNARCLQNIKFYKIYKTTLNHVCLRVRNNDICRISN